MLKIPDLHYRVDSDYTLPLYLNFSPLLYLLVEVSCVLYISKKRKEKRPPSQSMLIACVLSQAKPGHPLWIKGEIVSHSLIFHQVEMFRGSLSSGSCVGKIIRTHSRTVESIFLVLLDPQESLALLRSSMTQSSSAPGGKPHLQLNCFHLDVILFPKLGFLQETVQYRWISYSGVADFLGFPG